MDFNIELAQQLLNSSEKFPVDFEEAWTWLGFKTKGNAKRSLLNSGFIEGQEYLLICDKATTTGISAFPDENIRLTVDCFKMWGMAAGTAKGKEIRKYFLDCEKVALSYSSIAQTQSTQPQALPVIMPTAEELEYMRSRTWEKEEMASWPVPAKSPLKRSGYRRAIDIMKTMQQKTLTESEQVW